MTATEPLTMPVEEACKLLAISRGLGYRMARSGELPGVLKFGSRYVVSRARLLDALGEHVDPPEQAAVGTTQGVAS